MKNYGIDLVRELAEQSDKDWVGGVTASLPCIATIPEIDRDRYMPIGELQFGIDDFMDCATRGPLNAWEAKFTYLYRNNKLLPSNKKFLEDNGYVVLIGGLAYVQFSDRFVAMNSGTTRTGNSLKAPCEAARVQGLIPKKMLPAAATMTFDQYHNKADITAKMIDIGKEFAQRFQINYEKIYDFKNNLAGDFIDVAGYAWADPVKGIYEKVPGNDFNHCFLLERRPLFRIFDNYLDVDGDYYKQLAADYIFFEYGYRIFISGQTDYEKKTQETLTYIESLVAWLQSLTKKKVNMQTENGNKIYQVAKDLLGFDASPQDIAPDSLACAETVNYIVKKAIGVPVGGGISTAALYQCLRKFDKRFVEVSMADTLPGDIIISPTGYSVTPGINPRITHGHTGIVAKYGILSNNSENGRLSENYTIQAWRDYYTEFGRIPTFFFRVL